MFAAWNRLAPATISYESGSQLGRTRTGTMMPRLRTVGRMSETSGAFLAWRMLALLTESLPRSINCSSIFTLLVSAGPSWFAAWADRLTIGGKAPAASSAARRKLGEQVELVPRCEIEQSEVARA